MQPLTQLPLRSGKRFIFDKAHAERVCCRSRAAAARL
jgi:hypothetical protein